MPVDRIYYVYILASKPFGTLYVGMTNDLQRRMAEHRQEANPGFTKRYDVKRLVYVESFDTPYRAIAREKQLKAGSRQRKINLILTNNKEWKDLAESL
ncbi:MAG: GIY-YIG nuclease family protein [Candidatus Edwardsbacteria bacterium]|nr:GIY-YIG nuclease family protein [Candidatus Edwardsbacteria bacterium]